MRRIKSFILTILAVACTHAAPDASMAHRLLVQDGGFTLHPHLGDLTGSGLFAVAAYPERTAMFEHVPTEDDVRAYIAANTNLLERVAHSVGGWCERKAAHETTCFLDVILTLANQDEAIRLGKACNQIALAHLQTPHVAIIAAGGTGQALREGTPAFERCKQLREKVTQNGRT